MAEYIEREALSEYFREKFEYYKAESEIKMRGGYVYDEKMQYAAIVAKHFLDELKRTPTADVVEVVHGRKIIHKRHRGFHWIKCPLCNHEFQSNKPYSEDVEYCSECGKKLDDTFQNYCPNCGAKMDCE